MKRQKHCDAVCSCMWLSRQHSITHSYTRTYLWHQFRHVVSHYMFQCMHTLAFFILQALRYGAYLLSRLQAMCHRASMPSFRMRTDSLLSSHFSGVCVSHCFAFVVVASAIWASSATCTSHAKTEHEQQQQQIIERKKEEKKILLEFANTCNFVVLLYLFSPHSEFSAADKSRWMNAVETHRKNPGQITVDKIRRRKLLN